MPRWSISTTSRVRRTSARRPANGASVDAACPGPPARMTSGSSLGVSVFAGSTAAKILIVRPPGAARFSGTSSSPHCDGGREVGQPALGECDAARPPPSFPQPARHRGRPARRRMEVTKARDIGADGSKPRRAEPASARRSATGAGRMTAGAEPARILFGSIFYAPRRHARSRPRTGHRHRSRRPAHLRRLPAARPPARRAASALGRRRRAAAPRRDAVHHPAPGVGAVDEADDPRIEGRDRPRARRHARAVLQDPGAGQAHPEAAVRAVGGARDADAVRVRRVPPRARQLVGIPVAAVSRARVPAGRQERADARRVPPRRVHVRRARCAAARAVALRRVPAPSRAARPAGPGRLHRARLRATLRAQSRSRGRVQDHLRRSRRPGGTPTTCARSWWTSRRASSSGGSGT